jgi:hypothetical protein
MLQTNEFPRSILAALDALAGLGKAMQEQARKNQVSDPQIFTIDGEQAAKSPPPVEVAKLGQEEGTEQHWGVARYSDYITNHLRAKRASSYRYG